MRSVSGVQNATSAPAERVIPLKHIARVNVATLDDMTDPDYAFDYVDISSVTPEEGIARRERVTFGTAPSRARRKVAHGDTIASTVRTYLRAVAFVDEPDDLVVSTGFAVLSPCPGVDPRYLYRAVQSKPFVDEVVAQSTGVSYPAINPSDLGRIGVCLPDLGAQRAIADFLDRETEKIDPLVAKKQRLIELLQEKRTALISRAVTKGLDPDVPLKDSGIEWLGAIPAEWDAVPLGRIASSLQTGPFGSQLHSHEYIDDGTPVINPSNLRDGRVIPDWRCSVDEETAGRLNRHRVEAGDIVFGRRGEMGRCGLVRPAEEGWLCGTGCLRVKLQDELAVPAFFVLQLATNRVRDWLLLESVGSTMDNLNTSVVSRIPVAVPPVGTQHHIVSILAAHTAGLDTLATRVEAAIGCLGELRSALITAAVTGQVDVRAAL